MKLSIKKSIILCTLLALCMVMFGCTKNKNLEALENAINKNNSATYVAESLNMAIKIDQNQTDVKINGQTNNTENKSAIKVVVSNPITPSINTSIDMYSFGGNTYIKYEGEDNFVKAENEKQGSKVSKSITGIGSLIASEAENNKKLSKEIKITDEKDGTKKVSIKLDSKIVGKMLTKIIEQNKLFDTMEVAMEEQLVQMAKAMNPDVDMNKARVAAKEEAKKTIEQYKIGLAALGFENAEFTGIINKEGFLSKQNMAFTISVPGVPSKVILTLSSEINDINNPKPIEIPNIPNDKILNLNK